VSNAVRDALAERLFAAGFKREEDWFVIDDGEAFMQQIHIDTLADLARAALSAAPEADTILRELVAATIERQDAPSADKPLHKPIEARAWMAAFAWADAQKAPQPRTAPEQPDELVRYLESTIKDGTVNEQIVARTALRLLRAAAQPRTAEPGQPVRRWPFVETPGYFAGRLAAAHAEFHGDMLAAVRCVLIESPPTLAAEPAPAPADEPPTAFDYAANKGMAVTKEWCRGWDDCRAYCVMVAKLQAERSKPI
jgi:hypothetical protein